MMQHAYHSGQNEHNNGYCQHRPVDALFPVCAPDQKHVRGDCEEESEKSCTGIIRV